MGQMAVFDYSLLFAIMLDKEDAMKVLDAGELDGKKAGVVAKDGDIIGCFLPFSSHSLPKELRKQIAYYLSDHVASSMKAKGISEDEVLESLK